MLNQQVQSVSRAQRAGSSVRLTISDATELAVDSSSYALYDAQGDENRFIILGFEQSIQSAACAGLVGTCSASLLRARRRLQTTAAGHADVAVRRDYDFTASTDVSVAIEDRLRSSGLSAVSIRLTSLAAESTVTAAGTVDGNPLGQGLATAALAAAVTRELPNLRLAVKSAAIEPPALPPSPSPYAPFPKPAPPGRPPAPPSPPTATDFPVLVTLLVLFCAFLLLALAAIIYARTHPKNLERLRRRLAARTWTHTGTEVVPRLTARGKTDRLEGHGASPAASSAPRLAWGGDAPCTDAAAGVWSPTSLGTKPPLSARMCDMGTSTDDLPGAPAMPRASPPLAPQAHAIRLKAASAKLFMQIMATTGEDAAYGGASRGGGSAGGDGQPWVNAAAARPGLAAFASCAPARVAPHQGLPPPAPASPPPSPPLSPPPCS